ncbi:MAG: transporter associated domain-containing protein, partial [Hyphomicrobiaceae bacterium]
LVEEVVGEIEDEHDENATSQIQRDTALGLVASARTPIDELEAFLECKLLDDEDDEDIDTLGGLVFSLVGRIPVRGEVVPHPSGYEFEVLDADPRRIKRVRILTRQKTRPGISDADGKPDLGAA